jgi:hypothetical protein
MLELARRQLLVAAQARERIAGREPHQKEEQDRDEG